MTDLSSARAIGRVTAQRLVLYYLALTLVVAGLEWFLPDRGPGPAPDAAVVVESPLQMFEAMQGVVDLPSWTLAIMLSVLAVLLAMPFSMVYVRTRTSDQYDRSLVHSVLALPLITTTIVVVVRDSLSLAFSLAGIVAAVRFRSNLKESRDAIYIFAAIGIGFACGVEAMAVALGLSASFCILELWQWKYGIGAEHDQTHRLLCGPPLDLEASLRAFDLPPARVAETVARAAAGAPVVRAETSPVAEKPPVPQVRVRLRIDGGLRMRPAVEEALAALVKKVTVLDAVEGPPAELVLLLRPKRKLQGGALHAALSHLPGAHLATFEPLAMTAPATAGDAPPAHGKAPHLEDDDE